MEKNNVLKVGVFIAIGLWVVPLFWDAVESFENVFKTSAMIVLGGAVVLFVGYDTIMPWFNKKQQLDDSYMSAYEKKTKEIRKKVEDGEITIEQGLAREKDLTETYLDLSEQKQALEKKKQQLKQIQGGNKKKGGGIDLGGLLGGNQTQSTQNKSSGTKKQADKKPDMLDNVMGAMRGEGNERGVNISQQIKNSEESNHKSKQKSKKKDNLDDLRDLF